MPWPYDSFMGAFNNSSVLSLRVLTVSFRGTVLPTITATTLSSSTSSPPLMIPHRYAQSRTCGSDSLSVSEDDHFNEKLSVVWPVCDGRSFSLKIVFCCSRLLAARWWYPKYNNNCIYLGVFVGQRLLAETTDDRPRERRKTQIQTKQKLPAKRQYNDP